MEQRNNRKDDIRTEEISFVIQGPVFPEYTEAVCKSIRAFAPGSEIILSTWEGTNTEGLDYDKLVESADPGNFIFRLPEKMDNGTDRYPMNINRQIVSTKNGILAAGRKYVCKLRSDLRLEGLAFLKYYEKYNAKIQEPYSRALQHRVVTLCSVNPKRLLPFPYYLCDWFFFGLKEDVLNLWDIPLIEEKDLRNRQEDGTYPMVDNFGNEQYLWISFLKKFREVEIENGYALTEENLEDSERSYANCCIFVTAKHANVYSMKVKNTGYGAYTAFSNAGLYTENDWIRLYNRHCLANEKPGSDFFENLLFKLSVLLRSLKKTKFRKFYEVLKRMRNGK